MDEKDSGAESMTGAAGVPASRREVQVGGGVGGSVVAGDYNVVVDAQHGSVVSVLVERERPSPVRRAGVVLLPRRNTAPVGRDSVLATLAAAVASGGSVQLCGPSGVGKSTLLRYAAHSIQPGPDGVLYVSAASTEVADLAQEIFEACYEAPGYAPSRTELRRLMTGVRVRVYVDDADFTVEQLRALADTAPDATFVFAGETASLAGEATVLEIEGLDHDAALRLIARELNQPLLDAEIPAATSLWHAAAGRPLPLIRAAALARPDSSGRSVLPRPARITDLLGPLFDQLDANTTAVLTLLATLQDADLAPAHLAALTDLPDSSAVCERLSDLGLVLPTENGYQCAPDIVGALRQRHPDPFPVDRLCAYFTWWAKQSATTPADVACCVRALDKVAELAERSGRPELVIQLARSTSAAMPKALRFGVWGRLLGRGWLAAQRTGDRRAAAYFMHEEGIRSLLTGRRVIAGILLAEAAALWTELGDTHGATSAINAQHYAPPPQSVTPVGHAPSPALPGAHGAGAPGASAGHGAQAAVTPSSGPAHTAATHMAGLTQTTAAHTTAAQTAAVAPTTAAQLPQGISAARNPVPPNAAASGPSRTYMATTAGGGTKSGLLTMGTIAAVVGAIVIGAIAVSQHHEQGAANTALPRATGVSATQTTEIHPAGIVGRWRRGAAGVPDFAIVASGSPGSYTLEYPQPPGCNLTGRVQLTGNDASASGTEQELSQSCEVVGTMAFTFTVSADGRTLQVLETPTYYVEGVSCSSCQPETATRIQ